MIALLKKEWRSQWPFAALIVFLVSTAYAATAATKSVTHRSLESLYGDDLIDVVPEMAIILSLLSMAVSYGLLVRDLDDRTIDFLDALPVTRTQIFASKFLAGLSVLWLLPLLDAICLTVSRSVSMTSLDRQLHLDWVVIGEALVMLKLFTFFSIGLLLSFARRFGWLLLGIAVMSTLVVGRFDPTFQLENLSLFSAGSFDGRRWRLPWGLIAGYVGVGSLALLSAYGLFLGGGTWLLRQTGRSDSRIKQIVLVVTSALIGVVGFSIAGFVLNDSTDGEDPKAVRVRFSGGVTSSRRTRHFEAIYPSSLSDRAGRLLDDADEIHETVSSFLGGRASGIVRIDMTATSDHHLGVAYWERLKMDLTAHQSPADLRATLGHETTHVILESLSDGRLGEQFESTRAFHEGVATYVERRFFTPGDAIDHRLPAAVIADRGEADFARLVDNDRLRREHDSLLVYELGEVFAAATVSCFGDEAPGRLAGTFADPRHTEGLSGVGLWRSVFQATGYSLSRVIDEYHRLLGEAVEHHADRIEILTRADAVVTIRDGYVVWKIDTPPPTDWRWVIRLRASASASDEEYGPPTVMDRDPFFAAAPVDLFVGRTVWFQIGLRPSRSDGVTERTIFQPWQSFGR